MRSILLDIIPRRFRRRSYLVSGTIFLRALLNFAGLALLIPVLLLILDSESMHTNPWLERLSIRNSSYTSLRLTSVELYCV